MILICKLLDIILNPFILVVAVGELALLIKVIWQQGNLLKRINKLNGREAARAKKVEVSGKKHTSTETLTFVRDWDEYDRFYKQYQDDNRWYTAYTLVIQLFPLLGILGTVAGLYLAMQGNQDWQSAQGMFEGVRFALSSTIYGIMAAIAFKIGDVALQAFFISYIEDGIQLFQGNYNQDKER